MTDRKNLDLTDMPEDLVNWLQCLDDWAVDAAVRDSERLFKKKISRDDVLIMYTLVIKPRKRDWPPTIRLKWNVACSKAVRCWERASAEEYEETKLKHRALLDEFRDCRLEACVQVGYIWLRSKNVVLCLNISDLVVSESGAECPFQ